MTAALSIEPSAERCTVLVLEPKSESGRTIVRELNAIGQQADHCESSEDAIALLAACTFDLVINALDDVDSAKQFDAWLRQRHPRTSLVKVFAMGVETYDPQLAGVTASLQRPIESDDLHRILALASSHRERVSALLDDPDAEYREERNREALAQHLKLALAASYLVYQPIVRARSNCVVGYEALLRTRAPRFQGARPLLAVASRMDQETVLDATVQRMLASEFEGGGQWRTFFVNFNAQMLMDGRLATPDDPLMPYARRVIAEFSQDLQVPVTRTVLDTLDRMREAGFRVAAGNIDSTTSSLVRMRILAPDIYKLGVGLIRRCDTDTAKQRYIANVVEMAHGEGALVVAQGIERPEELQTATELGCDLCQGFLLGIPRANVN